MCRWMCKCVDWSSVCECVADQIMVWPMIERRPQPVPKQSSVADGSHLFPINVRTA